MYCILQVVYEYAGSRNLQNVLEEDSSNMNEQLVVDRQRYALQLADALQYCHSQRVMHLDVKPANVLLTDLSGDCKLADFGSSRLLPLHKSFITEPSNGE